jgi:predicted dienelactone hydrolase
MRVFCLFLAIILIGPRGTALAQSSPYHAGIGRPSIAAAPPFDALVWYPTQTEEVAWQVGPFAIPATHNAVLAPGRFPIVLLSHGGGLGGGTPLMLRELSADLARRGFIVVAPFHGKTGLQGRTLQIRQALDAVLADPRFASHADATRLGMLGFSLGTAVTLELAGAIPNLANLTAYCAGHPNDVMSCDHAPDGRNAPSSREAVPAGAISAPTPLPLKAIVLLDPYAVLFQRPELVAVSMPVLIFRPAQSELPGEANAFGLQAALPHPPEFQTIPGSHFVFMDVCPPALKSDSPELCQDPPNVDRAAVHTAIEAQIADFLGKNL